jgi:hypothetical protein
MNKLSISSRLANYKIIAVFIWKNGTTAAATKRGKPADELVRVLAKQSVVALASVSAPGLVGK